MQPFLYLRLSRGKRLTAKLTAAPLDTPLAFAQEFSLNSTPGSIVRVITDLEGSTFPLFFCGFGCESSANSVLTLFTDFAFVVIDIPVYFRVKILDAFSGCADLKSMHNENVEIDLPAAMLVGIAKERRCAVFKHFIDLLINQFNLLISSVHWMTPEEYDNQDEFFEEGMYQRTDE